MPDATGSIAYLGAARFQGLWNASNNEATGSALDSAKFTNTDIGQIPGLSIPCGFTTDGLPIGLQLEAAWWEDPMLLRVGHSFQEQTDWHLKRPNIQ